MRLSWVAVGSQVWELHGAKACSSNRWMFGLEWLGLHRALHVTPHVHEVGSLILLQHGCREFSDCLLYYLVVPCPLPSRGICSNTGTYCNQIASAQY